MSDVTPEQILLCPMGKNDADAATVGEYLGLLLSTLWLQRDDFSGKRPLGNSDWPYQVYIALSEAGLITGVILDEHGYVYDFPEEDETAADELILQTIRYMYKKARYSA